ncbi:MAG: YeeE/YedE family protein [Planctomycetota bacterium]
MDQTRKASSWKAYSLASLVGIVVVLALALVTRIWVLTAIPIGFLFGFFLQKGDLCGSSAFSEVIMMKDRRKVFGLWVVIVVGMAGIAALDLLGWVKLNPKPLTYLNYIVGGLIFGVGMVLAGGCVSGCLYKAGSGNLNSIVALAGIPLGVMVVEHGPLNSLFLSMKGMLIKTGDGEVMSLPNLLGLPFWVPTLFFGAATLLAVWFFRKKTQSRTQETSIRGAALQRSLTRPWKPWVAGLAIGLLMIPAYLSSAASGRNYPLGVTHGVMQAELLLIDQNFKHVWKAESPSPPPAVPASSDVFRAQAMAKDAKVQEKKVSWWLVALVLSLILGSFVSGRLSGQARLLPKPPDEVLIALLGGVLVGIGAAIATGCVVGNIMSGWALMSIGNVLFAIVAILANWATTYFYMMGGAVSRRSG